MKQQYFSVAEVAVVLNVSRKTIYRLIEGGYLIGFPIAGKGSAIRISGTSIDRYVQTQIENYQINEGINPK